MEEEREEKFNFDSKEASEEYKIFFKDIARFQGALNLVDYLKKTQLDRSVEKTCIEYAISDVKSLMDKLQKLMKSIYHARVTFSGNTFDEQKFLLDCCTVSGKKGSIYEFSDLRSICESTLMNIESNGSLSDQIISDYEEYTKFMSRAGVYFNNLSNVLESVKAYLDTNVRVGNL